MPSPLSGDLKERIVKWYTEDQLTMQDIADQGRCSVGLVCKVMQNYYEFGSVNNPFTHRRGRPSYLNEEDMLFLNTILTANPSLYLDEMQKKLQDARGVHISISTISRVLAAMQLSKKVVTKEALERDEELRTLWEMMMAQYTNPDVFVALEESAVDSKTPQRQTA